MMDLAQRQEATTPVENGTFSYLGTLPRVPLPELQDSLTRFEQWCAPLLTEEELEQTREAIAEFASPGGPGVILHAELKAYDQQPGVHSWLDEFWPARYLGRRVPVSINANFIMAFIKQPLTQIQCAALLVGGGVRYKQLLDQTARSGTDPTSHAAGQTVMHGTEQIPVLCHPHPRGGT